MLTVGSQGAVPNPQAVAVRVQFILLDELP